jgi:hypothetical protein
MIPIRLRNYKIKIINKPNKLDIHKLMIKVFWKEAFIMIQNHRRNKVNISLIIEQSRKWISIKEISKNSFEIFK